MKSEVKGQLASLANRQRALKPDGRLHFLKPFAMGSAVSLLFAGVATAQGNSPTQLRQFIGQQVGGIQKLMVPERDSDLPQPRLSNGSPDPFFQTTEAK